MKSANPFLTTEDTEETQFVVPPSGGLRDYELTNFMLKAL